MVAIVHMLAGAVTGSLLASAPAVVVVSFFSHYVLDMLPHVDPETLNEDNPHYTSWQWLSLIADAGAVVLLAFIFYTTHPRWSLILLGSVVAILPDLFVPLERFELFAPLRQLHEICHWDDKAARRWSWYIAGIVTPVFVASLALLVVVQTY